MENHEKLQTGLVVKWAAEFFHVIITSEGGGQF